MAGPRYRSGARKVSFTYIWKMRNAHTKTHTQECTINQTMGLYYVQIMQVYRNTWTQLYAYHQTIHCHTFVNQTHAQQWCNKLGKLTSRLGLWQINRANLEHSIIFFTISNNWTIIPWYCYLDIFIQWETLCRGRFLEYSMCLILLWTEYVSFAKYPMCPMMTSPNGNIHRVIGPLWGNPPVTGGFPSQRPVRRGFDIFFDVRLNKRLGKKSRCRWFETPWPSLWRHCNAYQTHTHIPNSNIYVRLHTIASLTGQHGKCAM